MPTRTSSSKSKALPAKKGSTNTSAKDMKGEKPKTNGAGPIENGVNGTEDVEMADEATDKSRSQQTKEGEEEMTVIVPPPNSSKLSAAPEMDGEGDIAMEGEQQTDAEEPVEVVDPKVKAIQGILVDSMCR
jgi:26S proteasome regulatory subunit N3